MLHYNCDSVVHLNVEMSDYMNDNCLLRATRLRWYFEKLRKFGPVATKYCKPRNFEESCQVFNLQKLPNALTSGTFESRPYSVLSQALRLGVETILLHLFVFSVFSCCFMLKQFLLTS